MIRTEASGRRSSSTARIVYLDRDVPDAKPSWGVTLTSCLLRPKARGSVRLRSADPNARPLVNSNFFGDPDDLRLTIASIRRAGEVLATPPMAGKFAHELLPGRRVTEDEARAIYCGKTVKDKLPSGGSARMGPEGDAMAVLDMRPRVREIAGPRVIDCSAMPFNPSGNTNGPVMALASRAADFIARSAPAGGQNVS